jgi:catechol 2,3-dioxygenase-like lactoylglutathione lyase family enzyme
MRRFLTSALLCTVVGLCTVISLHAAADVVIGSGNFSPIVQDLDKSLDFYSDLLGVNAPGTAPRPYGADAALVNFLGTPSGQVRVGNVRIPGSTMAVEIVDFKDIDRKALRPRLQDPGAVRLILLVRDVDTLLTHVKQKGVPVVTAGGAPVNLTQGGKARAVVVKDPDGFFIELMQPDPLPETAAPAVSNVIGARFGLTIADTDQTMRVYRDLLGFQPQIDVSFTNDKASNDLMATPNAQVRRSTAMVPGSTLQVEFLEFKGIERNPIGARIQDPGATRLQLRVRDSDAAVKLLTAAGGTVITTGGDGGPINMRGLRLALVRELNNLFLVIMAQGAPAPPAAERR